MRDILITLIVFGAIPFIMMRPHIGILIWSWLGYMNPHRLAYGFAYTMPFTMVTAAVTIVAMLFNKEKKSFPWTPITITWLIFVFFTYFTFIFAINPESGMEEFTRFFKIQVMIICTLLLINSKEKLIQLVAVIAFSIGFFGIKGGVFAVATGFKYKVSGPAQSFIGPNNEMALALLMIVPLLYFLFTYVDKRILKIVILGSIFLCFFSIVASYSRGAFLGMIVMLFFLWLGTKRKVLTVSLIVGVIAIGLPFLPEQWFDRMNTIETYEEDKSAMGRINAWKFAINLANNRPLTGGGYRAFSPDAFYQYAPVPDDYHDAHSIYFEMLGEQGYVGLLLFLSIWALVFLEARKIKKMAKAYDDLKWMVTLVTMIQVSIIAYMTAGAFLGLAYFDLPYHMMSIIIIAGVLCRKEIAEKEKNDTESIAT